MATIVMSRCFACSVLLLALRRCGTTGTSRRLQVSPEAQPKTDQLRPTTLESIAREDAWVLP